MSLISTLRSLLFSVYDYQCQYVNNDNINIAVIHIPDQIGDALAVFPVIRSLERRRIGHLIIVASEMNQPVFESLTLSHTRLSLIGMRFQDRATLSEIKSVAKKILNEYGRPDICIEAMRKKNLKTMCFISNLRAKLNLQIVGLTQRCYSPSCKIASRMDQHFRAPVPMSWAILMREAGFPAVRPMFEFPLSAEVLAEVRGETSQYSPYIVFNFEGSIKRRTFSRRTASRLIALIKTEINLPIIIVHGPGGTDTALELIRRHDNVHRLSLSPSITRSAAVITDAYLTITPDTSILHIASAFNIPAIAVYANYKTRWPAMQDISETIVVGSDIDKINFDEFTQALRRILGRIGKWPKQKTRLAPGGKPVPSMEPATIPNQE